MVDRALEYLFHPRSIAFVGISSDPANPTAETLIGPYLEHNFEGGLYPVNPKGGEWRGLKIYQSLKEIPGPVDSVIIFLAARSVPEVMRECVEKGVKVVTIFSAGFSELGTGEGRKLETRVIEIAKSGGIRVIGPNCFGIYCPKTRLGAGLGFPKESGSVSFISQSGASFFYMVRGGSSRGIRFSKVISYGNGSDLNESDFLEYLASDPETAIITAYLEGIKDGRRFFKALKAAAEAKPVIIYKGGYTEAGAKTATSHTGSLAVGDTILDTLFKQTGVIRAYGMDELIDLILAFSFMPPPRGPNVGIIGTGGGASVQIADECERAGLRVTTLSAEIITKLSQITPEAGNIIGNPLDSQMPFWDINKFAESIRIIANWEMIDVLILHRGLSVMSNPALTMRTEENRRETYLRCAKECGKPAALVLHSVAPTRESWEIVDTWQRRCNELKLPLYFSFDRAASAISKLVKYYKEQREKEALATKALTARLQGKSVGS